MKTLLIQLLPKLRRFAFSLTGNIADADDLVQNTVERILKMDPPKYEPSSALIFTVCKNVWVDEVRKRQVRRADVFTELEHSDYQHGSSQEEAIELKQLMKTLDSLPDSFREVLSMIAIAGMSYAEVAEQLDIPVGTVMSRISRARVTLAEVIQRGEFSGAGGHHAIH